MSTGVKISELPNIETTTGDEVIPVVQGGITKKANWSAAGLPYDSAEYPTVAAALDKLLYVAPAATLSLSVGTIEIGSVVSSLTASWTFNKSMASISLTDASVSLGAVSHSFTGLALTTNKTYTLTFSDGVNAGSVSRSVTFLPKRYWGVSSLAFLEGSDILALNQELSSSKNKSISYDCSGGRYFYFCYPSNLGAPASVTVGGLAFSDYMVTVKSFTNAYGYTQNYNVIRCNTLQTGSNINVVWT